MDHEIDLFTSDRIIDAAARGDTVEGFEPLGASLTALHDPTPDPGSPSLQAPDLDAAGASSGRFGRRVGVASVAAFMALSGAAAALTGSVAPASEEENGAEESDETDFNFGYDEEHQVLVWGTEPHGDEDGCEFDDESVEVTYSTDDGEIVAEVDEETCELQATEVTGPNGQVNHGMFMKAFNEAYEGTGRGCVVRYLAQSVLGKGDQQINVPDVDPDFESVMDGDVGDVSFETAIANCERGNGKPENVGNGKPENVGNGKPESPGKSGDAPGRNRGN